MRTHFVVSTAGDVRSFGDDLAAASAEFARRCLDPHWARYGEHRLQVVIVLESGKSPAPGSRQAGDAAERHLDRGIRRG